MELFLYLAYEIVLCGGFLHTCHLCASTRKELKTDGAGAREKVEGCEAFKVNPVAEHIEDVFARHVGSGACGDIGGHLEATASVFTTDYSHRASRMRDSGAFTASCPMRRAAAGKMEGIT